MVDRLGAGPRRFSELHRGIDGITARMLTVTLRGLERDGILTRTVHAAVPPRVDYALTPLGETLLRPDRAAGHPGRTRTPTRSRRRRPPTTRGPSPAMPGRRAARRGRRQLTPVHRRTGYGATGSPASQAAPRAYSASTSGPRSPGMPGLTEVIKTSVTARPRAVAGLLVMPGAEGRIGGLVARDEQPSSCPMHNRWL